MADPEHVVLAKSGATAIAKWREVNYLIPNTLTSYTLKYQLEDISASERFEPEFVYGRARLDLSGASLSRSKLPGVDLANDELFGIDLTNSNLRMAEFQGSNLHSAHLSRSNLVHANFSRANLSSCFLTRSNLSMSTFSSANLVGADLSSSDLSFANLEGANLSRANLSAANLTGASLNGASLRNATLFATNLTQTDLTGADLRGANIIKAELESAAFFEAVFGMSTFVNCDLSTAIALDFSRHTGPSTIGLDTIVKSRGLLPKKFLLDAGVAEPFVAVQDSLIGVKRKYPSVLTIGSKQDTVLAKRLENSLRSAQISCWNFAADDESWVQSSETIQGHTGYFDRLVLICTDSCLESTEARRRLAEVTGGKDEAALQNITTLAVDSLFEESSDELCTLLKQGVVVDFRGWDDLRVFEVAVTSLINVLTGTID